MVQVNADPFTKNQLGQSETISEDRAKSVIEQLRDNSNYKCSLSSDKLVIQRFLRD